MDHRNKKKDIDIIGVQIDFGASQKGVAMGPLAIRYAGLKASLRQMGYSVRDKGDIIPPEDGMSLRNMIRFEQVNATNKQLYDTVKESLDRGHFPLVLGGDHSIAAGSVSAVAKHYEDQGEIGIIWIDAHGDWNDDKSTVSGNMHGMPYSAVCGWGPSSMVDFGQTPHFVPTAHCVQVGGHDFDRAEAARMKEAGMKVFITQPYGRTRDYKSVVAVPFDLGECLVELQHMLLRRVFRGVRGHLNEVDSHMERRVGQQT